MPRRAKGLTANTVRSMPPGRHADGQGLYLVVSASGARSWLFRYLSPTTGRRREMGLGSQDALSRSSAQHQVSGPNGLHHWVHQGVDPLDAATATSRTDHPFRQVAEAHIEAQAPRWRSIKHAEQWTATLEAYVYPTISDTGVADITVNDVVALLNPIWSEKPETAARVRQQVEAILAAAIRPRLAHGCQSGRRRRDPRDPAQAEQAEAQPPRRPALSRPTGAS